MAWALPLALVLWAQANAGIIAETESPTPAEDTSTTRVSVSGYLMSRFALNQANTAGLLSTADDPFFTNLSEGNLQLKLQRRDQFLLYADVSLFYQRAQSYEVTDGKGGTKAVPDHDVLAYRPLTVLNELYLSYTWESGVNFTIGRKRIVWGPGLAVNPTDVLNPAKDPTDPTFQRAGVYLLRLEAPLDDNLTFSLVAAAKVMREYGGVPVALLRSPSYDTLETLGDPTDFPSDRDDMSHYALLARLYVLLLDTDINFFLTYTNAFNDVFTYKARFGFTMSRYMTTNFELHTEVLFQQGSANHFVSEACLDSNNPQACGEQGELLTYAQLNTPELVVHGLFGGSYTFPNDAVLSLEYLLYTDGFDATEFSDAIRALQLAQQVDPSAATLGSSTNPGAGSPQKFVFEGVREHYLFATLLVPHIFDDFAFSTVCLLGLEDMSGLLSPAFAWSVRDWLTLSVSGFFSWSGPDGLATTVEGSNYSELGLLPVTTRVFVAGRAYF